jgi:hypothetical protein
MDRFQRMLSTHPDPASDAGDEAYHLIAAAAECALTCTTCADACLSEPNVEGLVECIRLNHDCADICATTAAVFARAGHRDEPTLHALIEACAAACQACGEMCERHADHEHCRICAEICRRCAEACERMTAALVP